MEVKFTKFTERIGSFILGSSRQWSSVRWVVVGDLGEDEKVLIWSQNLERFGLDRYGRVWNGIVNLQPGPVSNFLPGCHHPRSRAHHQPQCKGCHHPQSSIYLWGWRWGKVNTFLTDIEFDNFDEAVNVGDIGFTGDVGFTGNIGDVGFITCLRVYCGKPPSLGSSCTRWTSWKYRIDYIHTQICWYLVILKIFGIMLPW